MSYPVRLANPDNPMIVSASGPDLVSKLWFKSKPLVTEFINHAIRLQLITKSRTEGEVMDEDGYEAWTWFELCILENEDAKQPLMRNGKPLSWPSHINRVNWEAPGETTIYHGAMFDRRHDLLDLLEVGNCIGVIACARHAGSKNYADAAQLHATCITEDMFATASWTLPGAVTPDAPNGIPTGVYTITPGLLEGIPSGVYTIVPPYECHVEAGPSEEKETFKLWFVSPIFNEDSIKRLEDIQLFTIAHHKHANIDDEGNWSWFDLLIMENQDAKEPRMVDGRELIWVSHEIPNKHDSYKGQQGDLFTRKDELLRYLKPGNVIGVRVCAAGLRWENHARTARLAIRMSDTEIPKEPIAPPPVSWTEINKQNQALREAMRKMLPNDVSSTELALLNHSFRADGDDGCNKRPLRLLSLDGGGVRGVSELQILKVLFGNNGEVKPYKYFDMICGTSTGGLIAIMLGRLRMTIDESLRAYTDLAQDIFDANNITKTWAATGTGARYSADKLELAIKGIVKRYSGDGDPETLMLDPREDACKVFVLAVDASNTNNKKAAHLRTYYNPHLVDSLCGYKIWEAARATTAAPTYFARMSLGDRQYIDGGLGYNNPVLEVVAESRIFFGRARCIDAIVTLGTGQMPNIAFPEEGTGWWSNLKGTAKIGMSLVNLAFTSERAHLIALGLFNVENYFRFNLGIDRWIEKVYPAGTSRLAKATGWASKTEEVTHFTKDDWVDIGIALDNYKKIDELIKMTDEYLADTDAERERIAKCYANIMKAGDLVGEIAVKA